MKLATSRFGEIDLETEKIIHFPHGIPGFEHHHRFIMLHAEEEGLPFSYMQSVDDGELAFIVTNPFVFFSDYQFDLAKDLQHELHIQSESDVMVFSIVSVQAGNTSITLNLLAPVVVNVTEKLGKQIILHQSEYKTKHLIRLEDAQEAEETLSMNAKDV